MNGWQGKRRSVEPAVCGRCGFLFYRERSQHGHGRTPGGCSIDCSQLADRTKFQINAALLVQLPVATPKILTTSAQHSISKFMRTILYGILRTLPVLRSVKPRCFLHLAAQGIAICIEEHLPLENRPLCVVAEGRDLTAAVPVAHAEGLHEKGYLKTLSRQSTSLRTVSERAKRRVVSRPNHACVL